MLPPSYLKASFVDLSGLLNLTGLDEVILVRTLALGLQCQFLTFATWPA